jgi:hypothetical protein
MHMFFSLNTETGRFTTQLQAENVVCMMLKEKDSKDFLSAVSDHVVSSLQDQIYRPELLVSLYEHNSAMILKTSRSLQ